MPWGHLPLTFLGNPFVILMRMLYPILELAVVALPQSPCNRNSAAYGFKLTEAIGPPSLSKRP